MTWALLGESLNYLYLFWLRREAIPLLKNHLLMFMNKYHRLASLLRLSQPKRVFCSGSKINLTWKNLVLGFIFDG